LSINTEVVKLRVEVRKRIPLAGLTSGCRIQQVMVIGLTAWKLRHKTVMGVKRLELRENETCHDNRNKKLNKTFLKFQLHMVRPTEYKN